MQKAGNALKHIAVPVLELTDITYLEDGINFEVRDRVKGFSFSVVVDMESEKDMIKNFLNSDQLSIYRRVKVTNVRSIDENRFTLDNLPQQFSIVGLPDRQIKIESAGKVNFINLQRSSYDKVRSKLCETTNISFDVLTKCLIRKELLVLLLTLNAL